MSGLHLSSPEKPKRSRKKWIIISVAVVIVLGAGAMIASRKGRKPILITTDKAFRKNVTQLVTATGKIQPEIEVKISPENQLKRLELSWLS